jgi:hypothetical protein
MEALRIARLVGIRVLAAILVAGGVLVVASISVTKALCKPRESFQQLRTRKVLWPWLTNSYRLVLGTLAYNAFVFLLIEPILRRWFPPLSPWEHVQGVFSGSTRTTYEQMVPAVATGLWIAGNALVVTLLRGNARRSPAPAEDHAARRCANT